MKLIVVLGVTGKQGGSVAQRFLNETDWRVRGITRDPSKPSNTALRNAGVELVAADLDDVNSLVKAFSNANVIFGVTDFWQFIKDSATHKLAAEKGLYVNQVAYQRELQQAKNLIDAAAQVGPTLERFIWSSLSDTKKWSKGAITFNYHFDAKAEATKYLKATYPDLANLTNYLQVGFYMTNSKTGFFAPKKQEDGNYIIRAPAASSPKSLPWVHTMNDVGYFVHALVYAPAGTTMLGSSTKANIHEFCTLWTTILRQRQLIGDDKQLRFDGSMTVEEYDKAIPGGLGRELGETAVYSSTYGFDGGDPEVKDPGSVGVEVDKLVSLEEYIRSEDWSDVL